MFVYGICAGPGEKAATIAVPGIRRHTSHARIITLTGQVSIHDAYNEILAEARSLPDVEGVVLIHDDVRIDDPQCETKLRKAFADPAVAVVGVIGGSAHEQMSWWTGRHHRGYVTDNQQGVIDLGRGTAAVDTVDGLLLALSPWAVSELSFDARRYTGFHGYDAEICAQARTAAHTVMVTDIAVHHDNNPQRWYGDRNALAIAGLTWQLKWQTDQSPPRRLGWRLKRALYSLRGAW